MAATAFGWLPLFQIAIFVLGIAALFRVRLRVIYVLLACLGLATLPIQAQPVQEATLSCDMP